MTERSIPCIAGLLMILVFPVLADATPTPSCHLEQLIKAIDVPLSAENIQFCDASVDALLEMIHDPSQTVYARGRAVSALAYLSTDRSETALRVIAMSYPLDVLRDQSVRSLLARYRMDERRIELTFLMTLLSDAGPRLTRTIQAQIWVQDGTVEQPRP